MTPKVWTVLESAKLGDATVLPCASALAAYDPDNTRWESAGNKVAQELVSVNPVFLGSWLDALRPVRGKLTAPLVAIFQDKSRPETVHSLATNILADYASEDAGRLAELLMVSDHKAYRTLFPVAERKAEKVLPIFQRELVKKATHSWNDPNIDSAWTEPEPTLVSRVESGEGLVADRFAFCQTMPLDECLTTALALRKSGYRPVRFRPYADEQVVRVAAVWLRDGRDWRVASGLTAPELVQWDTALQAGHAPSGPGGVLERRLQAVPGGPAKAGTPTPAPAAPPALTPVRFIPVDVAGYVATDTDGKRIDRYGALWVEKSSDDDARLYVGLTADQEVELHEKLKDGKLVPRTMQTMLGSDGRTKSCGVWGRPGQAAITGQARRDQFEGNFEQTQAELGDQLLIDVAIGPANKPESIREQAQPALERADQKLRNKPDDLDARFARAMVHFRQGENQKAIDDLQAVIGKDPDHTSAKQYRVIALGRLGKKQDALTELAKFQKEEVSEGLKTCLGAVVAAEFGEGADKTIEALEALIKKQPEDAELRYDSARASSLISRAVSPRDKAKGRQLAGRSLQLLKEAVKNGDADFGRMDEDGDLDPIRDDPAFTEIMKTGQPDRRYAAVWSSDAARFEAILVYGLDPAVHLQKCRELIAQGYRPVSFSVSRCDPSGPPVGASVWHRPTIQEDVKDRLAERQARAAIGLVRMGKGDEIWPFLRHSPDPRLRSFIVNWLNPLGASAEMVATEFARLASTAPVGRRFPDPAPLADRRSPDSTRSLEDSGSRYRRRFCRGIGTCLVYTRTISQYRRPSVPPVARSEDLATTTAAGQSNPPRPAERGEGCRRPGEGSSSSLMDTILFDPETSIRRALILALGTYGPDILSPGEREPLIANPLDLYRNDPDAGIHGAAEWALRKWGQNDKLKETDAQLMKQKGRSEKRWFINVQGQTFAVIEGPVEFRMGSPATDTERTPGNEPPRRVVIPRSFAIATKEVTKDQFERFLKVAKITIDRYQLSPGLLNKFSPDPHGPWVWPDWYTAAHYCNWLSEQDGLPKEQWCYLPNESGAYAEGMSIPANVLERKGYRLPTEAEWEYACRAGAVTSRYYGNTVALLGADARYQANGNNHAWACGGLLPNDEGLFDMLGNPTEWAQGSTNLEMPRGRGHFRDKINISGYVRDKNPRLLRGGAFSFHPADVRSAFRLPIAPAYRNPNIGFRPARTYN